CLSSRYLAIVSSPPSGATHVGRVSPWGRSRSRVLDIAVRNPLSQLDDDPRRAADVAEPVDVLVLLHPADELGAIGPQASDDGVAIVHREGDVADARGVRGSARVTVLARRGVELQQLETSVAVRGPHHREVHPDSLEPDDAVHPAALDRALAFRLESEL